MPPSRRTWLRAAAAGTTLLALAATASGELDMVLTCDAASAGANASLGGSGGLAELCQTACSEAVEAEPPVDMQANAPLGFALVAAAGLSTSLGASLVFFDRCVTRTNSLVLAASLGFSGGVMLYVSFVEILVKSVVAFEECECLWEHEDPAAPAQIMATLMFFGGILLFLLLDVAVHKIKPNMIIKRRKDRIGKHLENANEGQRSADMQSTSVSSQAGSSRAQSAAQASGVGAGAPPSQSAAGLDELALGDLAGAEAGLQPKVSFINGGEAGSDASSRGPQQNRADTKDDGNEEETIHIDICMCDHDGEDEEGREVINLDDVSEEERQRALNRMGTMTALAISLHNFPEGLATFAATLADPSVGVGLAVAIAIHNIPEGLCVSIPIFYATGSRCRGFWLATASGVAELVGAGLGYAFLIAVFDNVAYAVLFGLVAGMMVAIVVSELLPTAQRYDPKGRVSTPSLIFGMAVMALSLVLFKL